MDYTQLGKTWTVPTRETDSEEDRTYRAQLFAWYLQNNIDAGKEPDTDAFLDASDAIIARWRSVRERTAQLSRNIQHHYDEAIAKAFCEGAD